MAPVIPFGPRSLVQHSMPKKSFFISQAFTCSKPGCIREQGMKKIYRRMSEIFFYLNQIREGTGTLWRRNMYTVSQNTTRVSRTKEQRTFIQPSCSADEDNVPPLPRGEAVTTFHPPHSGWFTFWQCRGTLRHTSRPEKYVTYCSSK